MDVIGRFAALSPRETAPASLAEVAPLLDRDPSELAAAADVVGFLVAVPVAVVALVAGRVELLFVAAGLGVGAAVAAHGCVLAVANLRESRALGSAPTLVGRAVLRTRIAPTAEGAAEFAAKTDGLLGDRLAEHVRRARGTSRSGFGAFADAWREPFPALYRAVTLLEAAANAPDGERDRALDRAMETVLDGAEDRAAEAADALQGPTTAVYAFGVLLPLALVAVLPAAGAAGVDTALPAIVAVYDLLLPAGLCCAAGWLLAARPVAFPPVPVGREHPAVPDRRWPPFAAGAAVAVSGWFAADAVLPSWTRPLAAAGFGVGTVFIVRFRPVVAVRRRASQFDDGLPDALYLVGRRVADGVAVERAVADAAADLDGVVGETFTAAERRGRQLRVGIEPAFEGTLDGIPSRRGESAARLLGLAAREGPPAGRALVETADHLDALGRVEAEARRDLGRVTATLGNTGAFFGPLVGGATVALADSIDVGAASASTGIDGSAPAVAALGPAIGAYVLLTAVVLTALATGLSRGLDRATVGYRVGIALPLATATYLAGFAATAATAGGL
ncbi:type II secretion system protein [Natronomonas sp.]|uniref:type II secretion system protein n=1 Tax=Natronomonas sp. TaxID=2184060 RepID=UPI002FC2CC2F